MSKSLLNILRNPAFKAVEENLDNAFPILWYRKTFKVKYKIQRP